MKEKIYIPVKEFPEINFIGQLLGPLGRSLTEINAKSGATITIHGKSSIKEGRDEPLHCLVTASTQDSADRAKELNQEVIETDITTPEHANDRKRQQPRDLAVVNGTFRDDEGLRGHTNTTNNTVVAGIICRICNGVGPWLSR
ncbi:hypothetical protein F5Y04DRAFT_278854 [Hypomontagnella monticulosa]|nr:hypothetical protein F5Y04DRAFT_278854 [Hypomontagnella monticulosa]